MNAPDSPVPPPVAAADLERRPTLFLVYTVHLDTQWRWTVQDTIRDFIPATLAGNFEIFERHPERVLSFEGAFRYRLMEEYYPDDFARLKEAVERGNWRPAGTMLDSPDVNCVAPESLLRHILYAKRWFEEHLGTTSVDIFLPDCFGFGHALPTIAAHCGLSGFSAQKFGNWGAPAELPFDVGRWLGPDGRGVVAALRPEGYGEGLSEDLSGAGRWSRRLERQFEGSGLRVGLMYVGLGDRGGRLGEDSLGWIERSVAGDGPVHVVQTGSDALFRSLTDEQVERLPEHRGELLLPTHGTGCWTSQAAAKRWNRACETRAGEAERAASLASWLGVMDYPAEQLGEAWQRFLWHQMHDDLTGTSIPEAYRFTWNDQSIALNQFETVLGDALGEAARTLDTRGAGHPVVVFNPLERPRCDAIEAELVWPGAPLRIEAAGPNGEIVPVQVVERDAERMRLVFAPRLPALGLSVWHLRPAREDREAASDLEADGRRLANRLFEMTLDEAGDVASLVDRRTGRELLAAPFRLEMLPDRSLRWPAWEIHHRDLCARPLAGRGKARVTVVEQGPVRATVEIARSFRGATFRSRIALAAGDAGERIDFDHEIDWRARGRLLKVALRQGAPSEEAVYGLGCGTIRRGTNTPAKYEVPGLWAAPAGASESPGSLALIAEGASGWDHPDRETLRLSLLRSPRVFRKFRHQGVQDHGHHTVRYALTPFRDPATTDEQASRFVSRPRAFDAGRHPGPLGKSISLLEAAPGIAVRAVKRREGGEETVVRLQEARGVEAKAPVLQIPWRARSTRLLDGCEDDESAVDLAEIRLAPYGLATVALDLEPATAESEAPELEGLALPFDVRVTSRQGERGNPLRRIPAELWPSRIRVGAVPFDLADASAENALRLAGQTLTWKGPASTLHLLAATTDRRRRAPLRLGSRVVALSIDAWDGVIGRWKGTRPGWRHRGWARPGGGFVRGDRIGWVATHLHDEAGEDVPYEYAYLFRYSIELEPGDRALELPRRPSALLFAVTLRRP